MIETKEHYRIWKRKHEGEPIAETIEALREVARAARVAAKRLKMLQAVGPVGTSPKWTQDLADALDALPDWLTDG